MKRSTLLFATGVVFSTAVVHGTGQQTGAHAARLAKEVFRLSVEARLMERQEQCLAAVPVPAFCTCLNADLPLELNFVRYVALVSAPPENLTQDEKVIQGTAFAVRDRCISGTIQRSLKR